MPRIVSVPLRFLAAVMAVSGVLLITDAGVTLAWQEPVSAIRARQAQDALARQLEALPPPRTKPAAGPRALEAAAKRYKRRLEPGEAFGRIELPTLGRSYVVVQGTGTEALRKGPGHFSDTPLPGQSGTVAIAGHRTTFGAPFRRIDELRRGDRVVVSMPYGRFVYSIERKRIVPPTAVWVTRRVDHDRLVLTACHPLYSAAQRIVAFARLERVEPPAREDQRAGHGGSTQRSEPATG